MRKFLLTLGILLVTGLGANAQTTPDGDDIKNDEYMNLKIVTPDEPATETKEEIKERKKRLREFNDDVAYAKASNSMRRGYFVLVADNIRFGNSISRHNDINPNSNFILVQNGDGIIQFALNARGAGPNGIGGWTGKGNIRNKRLNYSKNGDVHMQFDLTGPGVSATVHITLYNGCNRAVATVSGGTPITFYGEILPYRKR